ncbi:transcription elongation factor Elf1 like-domain-containing protein [Radiomyces spectabilis]|uniref:transcription elongation factor Elf1 like-domain-containing protein n=1 Tax=Radiomyces spectabilis TaxID=64574 RepID=UPI00221F7486|nr:transcription elongation factor Elf1 like-domain-containing protein [Radiomyces spectabilis]KAI8388354.1 transcription elongation factor Elf1 like-domain-containing protein [Radiomyces spectabilis]
MGKRKAKRKPQKKLKAKLDTQFNCLFCNHEKSVECRLDQQNKVGHLACKICDVSWQCGITYLDEPVDVYSAWIDACEEVNRSKRQAAARARDRERTDRDEADDVGDGYDDQDRGYASHGAAPPDDVTDDHAGLFGDDDEDEDEDGDF